MAKKIAPTVEPTAPVYSETDFKNDVGQFLRIKRQIEDLTNEQKQYKERAEAYFAANEGATDDGKFMCPEFHVGWRLNSPTLKYAAGASKKIVIETMNENPALKGLLETDISAKKVEECWHDMEELFNGIGIAAISRSRSLNITPR